MNLHEYQAKEVLHKYGIRVPPYFVARTQEEVKQGLLSRGWQEAVVKIQVHAGGRGKAGGVKIGRSVDEILAFSQKLIGMKMVGPQTGKEGVIADSVLVTEPLAIKKEYYLSVVVDRVLARPVLIASPFGGMDIEEIAAESQEKILTLPLSLSGKIRSYQYLRLAKFMGWEGAQKEQGCQIAQGLATAFLEHDASLIEINPLAEDSAGNLWALDAKMAIDDNALYRQRAMKAYYDPTQVSFNERLAQDFELAYIALDGNIGCMVNGAGLAMATMDLIDQYGGKPANFLDVGGSASAEKVKAGFKIILSDPQVKAILVNIFGGIMNCGVLADGIIAAIQDLGIHVPLVVRMEGTNVEEGKRKLENAKLAIVTASNLQEAAKKVVEVL